MIRPVLISLLLISFHAVAQKKPVTIDAVVAAGRPTSVGTPIWAPDGKSFLYQQGDQLRLYDLGSKAARDLFSLAALKRAAKPVPAAERFAWENRASGRKCPVVPIREGSPDRSEWRPVRCPLRYRQVGPVDHDSHRGSRSETLAGRRRVAFRRDHDLYVHDLERKQETRLTKNGSATLRNGELDWVYPEELDRSRVLVVARFEVAWRTCSST